MARNFLANCRVFFSSRAHGAAGSDASRHSGESRTPALIGLLCQSASSATHNNLHCGGTSEHKIASRKAKSTPSHDKAVQHCISAGSNTSSCSQSCAGAANTAVQPPMHTCPLCQKQVLSGQLEAHVNAELAEMLSGDEPPLGSSHSALQASDVGHQASAWGASHQQWSAALDGTARQPEAHNCSHRHVSAPDSNVGRNENAASGISYGTALSQRGHPSEQAQHRIERHRRPYTSKVAASLGRDCLGKPPNPLRRGSAGEHKEQERESRTQRQRRQESIREECRTSSGRLGAHDSAGNGRAGVSSITLSCWQPHLAGSKQNDAQLPSKVCPNQRYC